MANRAVRKIHVSNALHFQIGDIVRVTTTGEQVRVTGVRMGRPRSWHTVKRSLWERLWTLLRHRHWPGREYRVITYWYRPDMIRVVRDRPSPLPHRLP